ncbi:MAG: sulfatase [Planctomycetes bacterium]|nr:sulfatase [Planctomycetota bacterium]
MIPVMSAPHDGSSGARPAPAPRFWRSAGCAVTLAVLACGDDGAADTPRHLLLVSIDTLRADAVDGDSARRAATPNLDQLAASGGRFTDCWSPVPLTLPAHSTLLTGLPPHDLGLHDNTPFPLRRDVPTLASWMAEAGFATAAVVGGEPLARGSGVERGFERFADPPRGAAGATHFGEWTARDVTDAALAAWREFDRTRRRFLFVHYFDPHQPYSPPRDCLPTGAAMPATADDRYRGEVTHVDRELGRLLAAIRGGGERCLIVVTSDHGEGLGDLGERTHGYQLLPSTLRVPLLLAEIEGAATRLPPGLEGADRDRLASLADIAPTLFELLAVDPIADLPGVPLHRPDGRHPARVVETLAPALHFGCAQQYGVRGEGALLLRGGHDAPLALPGADWRATGHEDERLLLDPGRAPPSAEELSSWRSALADAFVSRRPPATDAAVPRDLSPLGYLASSDERDRHALLAPAANQHGRSALARRATIDRLLEAVATLDGGEVLPALAALDEILAADPEFFAARFFRGRAKLAQAESDPRRGGAAASEAAAEFARLLATAPDYPGASLLRIQALALGGEFATAVRELESAAARAAERGDAAIAEVAWLHGSVLLDRERAGRPNPHFDAEAGFGLLLAAVRRDPQRTDRLRKLERALNDLSRTRDAPPWVAPLQQQLPRR